MLIWCGMQWYMIYDIWEYLKMFDFVHAFLDSCVFCLWLLCIDWPCVLDSRCSWGGFTEQHVTSCEGAVWLSFCPILSSFWHVCQELNPKKDVKNILSHSDIVVGSGTVDGRHLDNQLRLLHIYLYIYTCMLIYNYVSNHLSTYSVSNLQVSTLRRWCWKPRLSDVWTLICCGSYDSFGGCAKSLQVLVCFLNQLHRNDLNTILGTIFFRLFWAKELGVQNVATWALEEKSQEWNWPFLRFDKTLIKDESHAPHLCSLKNTKHKQHKMHMFKQSLVGFLLDYDWWLDQCTGDKNSMDQA